MLMFTLLIGGISIDMYVWAEYRVNWVFIFGLNPRCAESYYTISSWFCIAF